ncbi:hypothetical protein MXD63_41285, partial [Frankia sp. Cpl3]|nr:hypothetical protein [Frankia sp. Cpl3]
MAAESLLEARVKAVINLAPFLTGTYPAEGAKRLLEAGIPLYEVTSDLAETLLDQPDGTKVAIAKDQFHYLTSAGWQTTTLREVTKEEVTAKWQAAQQQLDQTLSAFIDNTLQYAGWEKD